MTQLAGETRAPHVTSRLADRVSLRYLSYFLILPPFSSWRSLFVAERDEDPSESKCFPPGKGSGLQLRKPAVRTLILFYLEIHQHFPALTHRYFLRNLASRSSTFPTLSRVFPITGDQSLRAYLAGNEPP